MLKSILTIAVSGFVAVSFLGKAKALDSKDLKFKGDLRYRHEWINKTDSPSRNRHRIRARLGANANPSQDVKVGFHLISGSTDPISGNQTLGSAFSTKSVGIDRAYLKYSGFENVALVFGKQKQAFHKPGKSELIWDGDLRPEGISVLADPKLGNMDFHFTAGGYWVEERSKDSDTWLFGADSGIETELGNMDLGIGAGMYAFAHVAGHDPLFDPTDSFGNSTNDSGLYSTQYQIAEANVTLGTKVFNKPTIFFAEYVRNIATGSNNDGWILGMRLGKVKEGGDLSVRYSYRRLEKDAVLGVFTDSDFKGGGTDGEGHELGLAVGLAKNVKLGSTFFATNSKVRGDLNYYRGQLDLAVKM